MTLQIETVPCLTDNYAYLAHDPASGETAVIDVPEAAPILSALEANGWRATHVLLTHHHDDHVQGLSELLKRHPAKVTGAADDAHRLPQLDARVKEGDRIAIGNEIGQVIGVSGHTVGHIAFHFPDSLAVFTADSLMALGCGRVFEGTMPQMWQSLQKLAALPPETRVYSGHEYTEKNADFALTVDPENSDLISRADSVRAARARKQPTVPSTIAEELATNPMLRAGDPAIQAQLGLSGSDPVAVFTEIRHRKDRF